LELKCFYVSNFLSILGVLFSSRRRRKCRRWRSDTIWRHQRWRVRRRWRCERC